MEGGNTEAPDREFNSRGKGTLELGEEVTRLLTFDRRIVGILRDVDKGNDVERAE
jgi:hypothetical protein